MDLEHPSSYIDSLIDEYRRELKEIVRQIGDEEDKVARGLILDEAHIEKEALSIARRSLRDSRNDQSELEQKISYLEALKDLLEDAEQKERILERLRTILASP